MKLDVSGVLYLNMVLERKELNVKEEKRLNNVLLFVSLLMLLVVKKLPMLFGSQKSLDVLKELMYLSFQ